MKMQAAVFIGCLTLLLSPTVFAECGGCGYYKEGCSDDSSYCNSAYESPCSCTDPGYRYNDCMTKSKFCEAFGNDGAM
ncbi:MAG: hypothetical protein EPO11_02060 [Gammaproteobacteria bacterium]|nr:MAG: hypothetical protein EPO11_02060 [Gammaproteobacteria bacterium]